MASATAVQNANNTAIAAQLDATLTVNRDNETNYDVRAGAAFTATIAGESVWKTFVTGVVGAALAAQDADAAVRAGQIGGIAAADAQVALAAAKKAAADNNQRSADSLASLEAQPASYFGALATSVPQKTPNAFWEWIITMPGLDEATNFVCGIGDVLTFGGTKALRQNYQVDMVNYDSGQYIGGQITGCVIGGTIGAVVFAPVLSFIGSGIASGWAGLGTVGFSFTIGGGPLLSAAGVGGIGGAATIVFVPVGQLVVGGIATAAAAIGLPNLFHMGSTAGGAGRGLDAILNDPEIFMRWLNRPHPVDQPLSLADAKAVWDMLIRLGKRPILHQGHPGTIWTGPHINIGGTSIHIPVVPGFVP